MKLIPYLMFFNGDCSAAFDFYAQALGGTIVARVAYGDMPANPDQPPLSDEAKAPSWICNVPTDPGAKSLSVMDLSATSNVPTDPAAKLLSVSVFEAMSSNVIVPS